MNVFEEPEVPQSTIDCIDRYVNYRVPPGSFVRACLENNLKEAFGRADDANARAMKKIVIYMYNKIPAHCWGSPERVKAWLAEGGVRD